MKKNKVLVTQPSLPPLAEFNKSLEKIWETKWLTNNGQFHQEFEQKLATHLEVPYLSLFSNGTMALMTAYQLLGLEGDVITTPYSFVATTHAMLWNKLTPVFCDVDPLYGNLDPTKIEDLITERTTAIVAVHVYGNPCAVEKIDEIAKRHKLKVIYDAAHAFDVTKNGKSILNFGDVSILSFHATKVFNTIEGGAVVCKDLKTKQQLDYLKNFGFSGETTIVAAGINAKMNEIQAAFGLLQLKYVKKNIEKRQNVAKLYRETLQNIKGIRVLQDIQGVKHNYSYFPIFIEKEYPLTRDDLYQELKNNGIYGRRYFYPLISSFPMYEKLKTTDAKKLDIANHMAHAVICLPIYPELDYSTINTICDIIIMWSVGS